MQMIPVMAPNEPSRPSDSPATVSDPIAVLASLTVSAGHCGSAVRAAPAVSHRGPRQLHPLVRRRSPELLVTQTLEDNRFGSKGLAVARLLPEVAEAAPWTLTPRAVISVITQELLALTIPIRFAKRLVPAPRSFQAGVPCTVTRAPLSARRPYGYRRCKDTVIMPRRHHMNAEVDPQLATAKGVGASGTEGSAIVPAGEGLSLERAAQALYCLEPGSNRSQHVECAMLQRPSHTAAQLRGPRRFAFADLVSCIRLLGRLCGLEGRLMTRAPFRPTVMSPRRA